MRDDEKRRKYVSVRLDQSEYYRLQGEADRLGLNVSSFTRLAIERLIENPSGAGTETRRIYNPDAEFAEYLATAMALMIVSGAHATDGLDAKVKEMTLDIMKSLGAA